jgi:hypothetical protein
MAVALGQICAERFKHTSLCWYVYQPTGVGDWYRWRLMTRTQLAAGYDGTLPCLCGVSRGQVYAGAQTRPQDSDAANGFATGTGYLGNTHYYTNVYGEYRDYNVPTGMTHLRPFIRGVVSADDSLRFIAYSDTVALETKDYDPNCGQNMLIEGNWWALPAGTTKVRLTKKTDAVTYIRIAGLDWINKNSVVDPDTAGSVMYCGSDVPGSSVIPEDTWSAALKAGPPTTEMALYWSDRGGAYAATNSAGGLSHRGVDTATVVWQTQAGSDAPASWAPSQGDRIACDYLILGITTAKVYQESDATNQRGTLAGKLLFDAAGCMVDYTVTAIANMDVFSFYALQCDFPRDVHHVYFGGDESVRHLAGASIVAQVKSPYGEMWGGSNGTHYRIEHLQSDTNMAYHQFGAYGTWARVAWNDEALRYKYYENYYENLTTPKALDSGATIGTKFAIRLRDRRLSRKFIQRLL